MYALKMFGGNLKEFFRSAIGIHHGPVGFRDDGSIIYTFKEFLEICATWNFDFWLIAVGSGRPLYGGGPAGVVLRASRQVNAHRGRETRLSGSYIFLRLHIAYLALNP